MATANTQTDNTNTKFTADMVRTYLREIGRVPLLTREQEIVYGKQVQQLMSLLEAKKALAKKLRREPTLEEWAAQVQTSEDELNEVLRAGQRSKQKMIEANLRLVVAIAKKYQKRNMEFLDLIQEGTMGLERGVEKFDPTRGTSSRPTHIGGFAKQLPVRSLSKPARSGCRFTSQKSLTKLRKCNGN
jgi:RNA polymerase nonessential primary-like sigma factor